MGFLYYLPGEGRNVVTRADMTAAGLGYALTAGDPDSRKLAKGPDGGPGILAVPQPPAGVQGPDCLYQPDRQTWRRGPKGAFWVGYVTAARPGPEQLRRESVYDGQDVKLLDGNLWTVARCYAFLAERPVTLPRQLDLADDGETVIARPHPRYAKLCEDAVRWWLDWTGQSAPDKRLKPAEQIQLAVDALSVNYRVGKVETIGLLQLWGTDEFGLVLRAMIDADEVDEYCKARAADAAAGDEGDGGSGSKKD